MIHKNKNTVSITKNSNPNVGPNLLSRDNDKRQTKRLSLYDFRVNAQEPRKRLSSLAL